MSLHREVLSALPKNIDKVCSRLVILPPKPRAAGNVHADPTARISAMVNAMLLLRSTLKVLPALQDILDRAKSLLLRAMHRTCQEGALIEVQDKIDEVGVLMRAVHKICQEGGLVEVQEKLEKVIDTDAELSTSPLMNRVQQCFAVRKGADEFLDVARTSFQRITDKVKYSNRRGFVLHVPLPQDAQGNAISLPFPRSFLPVEKRGRYSRMFTTHELNALNARLQDAAHDCMVLTEKVLEQLVASIAAHLPLILRVADNVAMLDMLLAFSEGRHPLLEGNPEEPFHPNDTYIDGDCESLHIITGPNMAGKSTYLKQVALLVILAQAGSFVPADFMALCPFRSLFTRMGTGDSIETNSSSFMLECQEVAHILDHASAHSLVIVDELGRATSTADGTALAWAVCEALLASRTPCLFATHFVQLADLATLYPAAKLWNLQVNISDERMDYTWQLSSKTILERVHYGIALAHTVGFPQEVLDLASNVAEQVEESDCMRACGMAGAEQGDQATWIAVYAAASKLLALSRQCDSRVALGLQQGDGQNKTSRTQEHLAGSGACSHTHGLHVPSKATSAGTATGAHHSNAAATNAEHDSTAGKIAEETAVAEALQLSACKQRQPEELAAARHAGAGASIASPAEGRGDVRRDALDAGQVALGAGQEGCSCQVAPCTGDGQGDGVDVGPEDSDVITDEEAHQFAVHLHGLQQDVVQCAELETSRLQALMLD
ncbi:muts domain V-domain-containing protein [Dunaliella salina]|uniref:Muts domain V-domain-containing protein n=1 Tax=Dunaliella salina TaxID=3046 RepID=A0ABQ7G8P5_DUNSA|nr:muts domain V-domain-containing protein [Dunaliella salina]|eukprot:KAF5830982.1 muts domain V-domain-containing protein [Dunaliella salina]